MTLTIWTISRSTSPTSDCVALIEAHRIRRAADVRTIPHSRRSPQYDIDILRTGSSPTPLLIASAATADWPVGQARERRFGFQTNSLVPVGGGVERDKAGERL